MPKFDLNNSIDFARLTAGFGRLAVSGAAGILSQFTGRGPSDWDIREGAFIPLDENGAPQPAILFHVFQTAVNYDAGLGNVSDSGGRRKVKLLFPYQDGQLTEDLGRMPMTFSLDILFHGQNYMQGYTQLMEALQSPIPGIMRHPVLGDVTCTMESFQVTHTSEQRKALALNLTMIEHSFNGIDFRKQVDKSAKGALQKLATAFAKIDLAIAKVESFVFATRTLKNSIENALNDYKAGYAQLAGRLNALFNPGGVTIPALLPVNEGGVQLPDGTFATSSITNVTSANDPFSEVPVEEINTAAGQILAAEQLAKDIVTLRTSLGDVIVDIEEAGSGQGSLEAHDELIGLKETAIDMQDAYEKGKQSSQVKIIEYVTPRDMTIREVAFDNGLSPDQGNEIVLLNEELLSANFIAKGTSLKVAVT